MSSAATLETRETPARATSKLIVEPVTPIIGAELSGIDLRQPLDAGTAADIQTALHKWRVVFFRDQDITNDQLKAFGRAFGPLTPAHPISEGLEEHPEIWERAVDEYRTRRTENDNIKPGAPKPRDYKACHIAITFSANPHRYPILHGV